MSPGSSSVRPAAVAGRFYPGRAVELAGQVHRCLEKAVPSAGPSPKALIAPHAGYVYSGGVAGSAFAAWKSEAEQIRRVLLIGPPHYVEVWGVGYAHWQAFATPLGEVPVDWEAMNRVRGIEGFGVADDAHEPEHALEVELPFLQVLLGEFSVVPLLAGAGGEEAVAAALDALWGGPETRIVISSDLSHFLDYESAREMDRQTATAIEGLDGAALEPNSACGRVAIRGLLKVARRRGMTAEVLDLRNSGDTAGLRDRVVGYGAFALRERGL